jgi:hypothetical protein
LTLPLDTIAALKQIDSDLARAIVAMTEKGSPAPGEPNLPPDVDLVQLTSRESLIVVNRQLVVPLAGVQRCCSTSDDLPDAPAGAKFADLEAVQDSPDEDLTPSNCPVGDGPLRNGSRIRSCTHAVHHRRDAQRSAPEGRAR